jgi:hypothetical protein
VTGRAAFGDSFNDRSTAGRPLAQIRSVFRIGTLAPLALLAAPAAAQEALSPRNASYEIEVRLDPAGRTLAGRQILTWRNVQPIATDELWFHLYWNAWRNDRSTWMLEDRVRRRSDRGEDVRDDDWGWIEVDEARLLPGGGRPGADLGDAMRHASPDDGNPGDRTVLVVRLPGPVAPGEAVRVAMAFRARVPRTFARTGFRGDTFLLAHWYPILGVLEPDGWSCHQFHSATEFYSDYGSFDVRITVPPGWIVGATGREVDRTEDGDGGTVHRFVQDDVHNFAWTTSPRYVVREERFEAAGLPPIDMRLLMQPERLGQAGRLFAAARAAFEHYGRWFGPYPYGHVTIVDPAYGAGHGGMEYPTLFTCGSRLFVPVGGDQPESVTIHEAGHQFWYGLVGNDEFEHAWIDEGLNTYSTLRTLDAACGDKVYVRRYLAPPGDEKGEGLLAARFDGIAVDRWRDRAARYRPSATSDAPSTPTYLYHPPTAADITYSKTALWLRTLENHLGWERLQPGMAAFFGRGRFRHPTPAEFIAAVEEKSGEDLDWFFDEVFESDADFDYAVESVESAPAAMRGYDDALALREPPPKDDPQIFRTEVVLLRKGAGRFPVEVLLVFEDGVEVRERWDGRDRRRRIVVEREAKLHHAVVDPAGVLALDLDRTNNSRLREPASRLAAVKWGSKWMLWLQDLMHTLAFFG